jgi:signal transduction histidine kinase
VSPKRSFIALLRIVDLPVVDTVLAVVLTVAALVDAVSVLHGSPGVLAIAACVALTGSVAWRQVHPALTTVVAITGLVVFVLVSGYGGDATFQAAALALNSYTLGRNSRDRESRRVLALISVYWLAGDVVATYVPPGGTVGVVIGAWAFCFALPFAVGRTVATSNALARELKAVAARLTGEQELGASRAASEERNRMARELHDVIAHSVSVMVIQTSAARRVARRDLEAAGDALRVVESSGRDALVELRRIVGALRRDDELAVDVAPGLSQLRALVDRACAAGLPVELNVEGPARSLAPGLDLVVYRVIQEALTNAIKHAGPATATVRVSFDSGAVELQVADTGSGPVSDRDHDGSGHGLVGMTERVALYGGELRAGPRSGSGFEVRARIPIGSKTSSPQSAARPGLGDHAAVPVPAADGLRWPWLDPVLACGLFAVLEIAVLTSHHRRGPLVMNMIVVAGMPLAAIWRRRAPLLFVATTWVVGVVMASALTALNTSLVAVVYLYIPTYTLAAWMDLRAAVLGLALYAGETAVSQVIVQHTTIANYVGAPLTMSAAWAAGRVIRGRRQLTAELHRTAARLEMERDDRTRLAVAGERSRIARELHAAVARSVAATVVQTEAARSLLKRNAAQADAAMVAIEEAARETLVEMRRILGVLRHAGDSGELEPQPGVDQIYRLIQSARERGQQVELSVDGDPGTLPAGVDLGIYRILEDALTTVGQQPGTKVGVALRCSDADLELHLTASCQGPSGWPTDAMRERVTLCGGDLDADLPNGHGWRLVARMPRGLHGALA